MHLVVNGLLSPGQIRDIINPSKKINYSTQVSSSRVIQKTWKGASNLTDQDLQFFSFVPLGDGRVDIHLPEDLGKKLMYGVQQKLRMNGLSRDLELKSFNLIIHPPCDLEQGWHQDNGGVKDDDYFTVFIPLNKADRMGKTEFKLGKESYIPDVEPGDGVIFSAQEWHRGTPNLSRETRYCIYAIYTRLPFSELFEKW